MEPNKICPYAKCDGSGVICTEKEDGYSTARNCQCLKDEGKRRFLGERFWQVQLEDIKPQGQMQIVLKQLLRDHPEKGVFLFGRGGAGKTHFLAAMYNYWESRHKRIKYYEDATLKDDLRDAELKNDYSFTYELVRDYDCIFLDDLGKQQMTTFYRSALYRMFNEAYKNRRYIFITANDSLGVLGSDEYWGPHAARRVEDICQVVEF